MSKLLRRIVLLTVALSLVFSVLFGISAQGAASDWQQTHGSATLKDTPDNEFCTFIVNASCTGSTSTTHNMLEESIILRNFEMSTTNSYWSFIGIAPEASRGNAFNDAANGKLSFYLTSHANGGFNVIFIQGAWQFLGVVDKAETYTWSFVKNTNGKYVLQINNQFFEHNDIDTYCKSGKVNSYVNLFAQDWMKGEIDIREQEWDISASTAQLPKIYYDISEGTKAEFTADSPICSAVSHNWKKEKLEISAMNIAENDELSLIFNTSSQSTAETATKSDGSVLVYNIKKTELGYEGYIYDAVSSSPTTLDLSNGCNISFVEKSGKYALNISGTIIQDDRIDLFMRGATDGASYVIMDVAESFAGIIYFSDLSWVTYRGTNPSLSLNDDYSSNISINSTHRIHAPKRYDMFNNELVIENLELPSTHPRFYIGLIKNESHTPPNVASTSGITFEFEIQTDNTVRFRMCMSTGNWQTVATIDKADKYTISLLNEEGDYYIRLNGIAYQVSGTAYNDLKNFVGTGNSCMSYPAFGVENWIKAKISIKSIPINTSIFKILYESSTDYADGDKENGYTVNGDGKTYAYSIAKLIPTKKSVVAKVNDLKGGALYFALSEDKTAGNDLLPDGGINSVDRIAFLITPKNDGTKAEIAYWNAEGGGGATVISTIDYDWSKEHSFDVRKALNGSWYLAIDEIIQTNISSSVVNAFMNKNANTPLHYFLGGELGFNAEKMNIITQIMGDLDLETEGWAYWSSAGAGDLPGNDTDGYSASLSSVGNIFAFSRPIYDVQNKAVEIKVDELGDWFYFSVSKVGHSDSSVLPTGMDATRAVFVVRQTDNKTKAQIGYWNASGTGVEMPIDKVDFDWSKPHKFSVVKGTDNHWYPVIDGKMISGLSSAFFDGLMDNYYADGMHFGIGGWNGKFSATGIKVVDAPACDNHIDVEGWRYFSSIGGGNFKGTDKEGYSVYLESGDLFGFSKQKYNINETAVSFSITDIRNWLYFSVSTTNESDTTVLGKGAGDEIKRMVFIITPQSGATEAQFSIWAADGSSGESVIRKINFDWYEPHTLDVRKHANGHWYLCVDGQLLMNVYSDVFDTFMNVNNPEEMHYGIGGSGCFGAEQVKIVSKPPLAKLDDDYILGDESFGDLTYNEEFDFDNYEDINEDGSFEYVDIFTFDELKNEGVSENEVPEKVQVRIKKRRLVEKGHGIIFNIWEKIGMGVGAAAILAGVTVLVIFIIKFVKKKKTRAS